MSVKAGALQNSCISELGVAGTGGIWTSITDYANSRDGRQRLVRIGGDGVSLYGLRLPPGMFVSLPVAGPRNRLWLIAGSGIATGQRRIYRLTVPN